MGSPTEPELFERDSELATLADALARAQDGHGAVIAIEGPAGIGKTRLLAELRASAAGSGMEILTARGGELEREFSFGVVRQLFEPLMSRPDREELLAGAAAHAAPLLDGAPGSAEGQDAFAVLHGLFWMTVNLSAARPLLVAIDDLHWCDGESLRFVAYLERRVEGLPVLVALGSRPDESADATRLLGSVATAVRPCPLTEAATRELIRAQGSRDAPDAVCAACFEASGGNPLLLRELTRALMAEGLEPTRRNARRVVEIGGDAVAVAVRLRLERLPADAARLAEAAAVLG